MSNSHDIKIEDFRPLALKVASRYRNKGIEWEELKGIAYIGLVKAKAVFDPSRGSFATIAMQSVRSEITNTFDNGRNKLKLQYSNWATIIDEIPDKEPSALELIIDKQQVLRLYEALDKLPERHKFIVTQRYLKGDVTLRELADSLRISYQRVAQIEESALKQLRRILNVNM